MASRHFKVELFLIYSKINGLTWGIEIWGGDSQ